MNRAFSPYASRRNANLGRCPRLVYFRAFGPHAFRKIWKDLGTASAIQRSYVYCPPPELPFRPGQICGVGVEYQDGLGNQILGGKIGGPTGTPRNSWMGVPGVPGTAYGIRGGSRDGGSRDSIRNSWTLS